jgi:hypothetical protein
MRTQKYPPDGKRVIAFAQDVVDVWFQFADPDVPIPAQYALGTAQHESSFTLNEVDQEDSGYVSKGIYQLSDEEATSIGMPHADLLDLHETTAVMQKISVKRVMAIAKAAKFTSLALLPPDMWAYLFIAHNQGLAAALKSIALHGLNWEAYKARNIRAADNPDKLKFWTKVASYGDDVISGGLYWRDIKLPNA